MHARASNWRGYVRLLLLGLTHTVGARSVPSALGTGGATLSADGNDTIAISALPAHFGGLPGPCSGSVAISSSTYAAAARCTTIDGDLTISPGFTGKVVFLPRLIYVGGDVVVFGNPTVTSVLLPLLGSASSIFIERNVGLGMVNFTKLATVGASFYFQSNANLTCLTLPILDVVGGDLVVKLNTRLVYLSLPLLASVDSGVTYYYGKAAKGNLVLSYNANLALCDAPLLVAWLATCS